jgi:amidohydrolase
MTFLDDALQMNDETIAVRRDLHRHPELGLHEFRTAGIVAEQLRNLGLDVTTGIGETGVVGLLRGQSDSPVLLMRFDMDALPIQEDTGLEFASEVPGIMHACGHDGHMAVGLSVAKLLAAHQAELPGTIKFVFQPAEEGAGGAQKMVADGVLENPKPDYAVAMHVWNQKPLGWYGLKSGPIMAGAEIFTIKITGKGGHGASPHNTVDPIVATAQIIIALQTVVSRNINPLESAVVTVGSVEAGTAFNIIPQSATIKGTIRTFTPEVLDRVKNRLTSIVRNTAEAMGCKAEIDIEKVTFPVTNDPGVTHAMDIAVETIEPDAEIDMSFLTMGSEDFSFMMQGVPGCFMMVGSANPEHGLTYDHHHPKFNFDEACLPYAVAILCQAAFELLNRKP